jgi:hypothetical protein
VVAVCLGAMKMAMVDASSYSRQPRCRAPQTDAAISSSALPVLAVKPAPIETVMARC